MPNTVIMSLMVVGACALSLACAAAPPDSGAALELEPTGWQPPPEPSSPAGPAAQPPPPPPPPPPAASSEASAAAPVDGEPQEVPLETMMAQGIYTPDPSAVDLAQTKAARFDKMDGRSVIGFCVTTEGATAKVHVVEGFPGDPQVDKILMETIEKWRFKPLIINGQPVKACTLRTFNIKFKASKPPAKR